jgi:large subunit ribosomal protein L4
MRRAALRSALSAKVAEDQIVVVDDLALEAPKTKEMVEILERLELAPNGVSRQILILLPERNESVEKSVRNLPWVKTLRASYLNVRDLLGYDCVLMPKGALEVIESILG